ncbi:MAG TPA: universal stress protein [Burkholderiales bacterium]|nr:universal stress protein [Burkholderiales bacterium]
MYKHILVPTDGSRLSAKAVKAAAALAKQFGARLTGLYVIPPYVPPMYGEAAIYVPEITPRRYKELSEKEAAKALAVVERAARSAQVACKTAWLTDDQAWQGIVKSARKKKCDLIVMASHGRRGLSGLLLGSETTKVLTHSKVPVLVCR